MGNFYDNGGTVDFTHNLANMLNVPASRVKLTSVEEGSVIVNYDIESDDLSELVRIKNA